MVYSNLKQRWCKCFLSSILETHLQSYLHFLKSHLQQRLNRLKKNIKSHQRKKIINMRQLKTWSAHLGSQVQLKTYIQSKDNKIICKNKRPLKVLLHLGIKALSTNSSIKNYCKQIIRLTKYYPHSKLLELFSIKLSQKSMRWQRKQKCQIDLIIQKDKSQAAS